MPLLEIYDSQTGYQLFTGVDVAIAPDLGYEITIPMQADAPQLLCDWEFYGVVKNTALAHDGVWHVYMHKTKMSWVPRQPKGE